MIIIVVIGIVLIEFILRSQDYSLTEQAHNIFDNFFPSTRMSSYRNLSQSDKEDLLYLSYIDSLARDNRALPNNGKVSADERRNIVQLVLDEAGVPDEILEKWHIYPEIYPLNSLFRILNGMGKLMIAREGFSLYDDIRDRPIKPGYLVFGQTHPYREKDGINFCAILSSVNWFQPGLSTLIYYRPGNKFTDEIRRRNGIKIEPKLVHGSLKDAPEFTYFGFGKIGNNLGDVYQKFIRSGMHINRKSLYPK